MSELEEARVLRNSRKEKANETIGILSWLVTGYWELEEDIRKGCHSVTVTEKLLIRALRTARALRPTLHKAKGSLEKYEESIVRVMVLEGLEDWAQYSQGDEHAFESRGISDELDTLGNDVAEILACIDEEQTTAEVAGLAARFEEDRDNEEKFNEVYNELAEKAAEAQATFEVAKKYEREAAEAMKATFDKVYRELAREYEADSNRFKDFSTKADDNRYEAGGIRPRNRYKAGGIRPSNRFRARNMRSGNRYMTGGMRSGNGNGNRYKAGGMRSDNGYRYKAGGMRSDNGHRYRAANMRFGNRYGAGNVRSGSRNRAGSRNKASIRNRTGNRRSSNRKVVGVVDHFKNSVACRNGWTKRNTKPNHDQTRSGRAVQVRGLKGSKRAPKVEIKLRTLDGKEEIGTGMCYPDSAADCSIMGKYTMKGLGIKQQMLGPPDPELGILPEDYPNPIKQEPIDARSIKINGKNRMNIEDVTPENMRRRHEEESGDMRRRHEEENGTNAGNVMLQTHSILVQELLSMVQNKEEPSQADLQKVKETLMEEYADVFSVEEQLNPMKCTPMKIELKEDAIPTMCSAPRKIGPVTESRYAPIEFEALGVAWGVDKCRYFLTGLPEFIIRNDHRTLIPILNNKSLNEIDNPRLQRLVEKLRPYTYRAEHVSGKDNCIADALSRAPVDQPTEEDMLGEEASRGIRQIVRRAASCAGIEDELQETLVDPNMEWIKGAAEEDVSYQELLTTLRNGFPDRICETSEVVRPYFGLRDDLSEHNGLVILRSCRIVVPASLRKEILMRLHASHQGMERTQRRARETVYWPGIKSDIINTVASCSMCAERLPSQRKEPLKTDPRPERAFEQTASDLFHWAGNTYIVYVDRYSGWPCVHMWTATPTSRKVINQIKRWFVDWGVPLGVRSDGGPQYDSSEYREFLKAWGVNPPGLSTPTYAQSNGRAEAAVKAMKSLVEKTTVNGDINCDEFQKGLLEWRNTPKEHGKSPAELVFGCQQRSVVPSLQMNMVPKWKTNIEKKVAELQRRSERNYNIGARSLERLNIGDKVRVQNAVTQKWDDVGEIMRIGNNRDYVVNIPGKKMGWRNRRFIRFVEESGEDDGPLVRDVEYEWLIETQKNTEVNRLSSVSEDDGHSKPRRSIRERKPVIRFSL